MQVQFPIPPIDKYWNAPPTNLDGSPNADLVYLSVGRALSEWEFAETMFASLFAELVEGESDAAKRVYGNMTSTATKRAAIEAAAEIYASRHPKGYSKEHLKLLLAHYVSASGRRNEIAHGSVEKFDIDGKDHGFFLCPAMYNTKKNEAKTLEFWQRVAEMNSSNPFMVFGQLYRYTHTEIQQFAEKFKALGIQAFGFSQDRTQARLQEKFDSAPAANKATINLGKPSSS
jgi:hypothetical protein